MSTPYEVVELGAPSWTTTNDLEEGEPLHTRATKFLEETDWQELTSLASKFRGDISCELDPRYSIGHFNMVRCLTFADGVKWVARLRMPELEVFGCREALDPESAMKIEVATMKYLRANTTIPVPEVFAHDVTGVNAVGAPYIFMTYVEGNTAAELQEIKECELGMYGTPDQDRKFRQQLAHIHLQLAVIRFNQIGSLYETGAGGFTIGPEIVTGKGPWNEPSAYYKDCINHVLKVADSDAPIEVKQSRSCLFPRLAGPLMDVLGNDTCGDSMGYGLANRDLGAHNLLVDHHFNIVGLIDMDGIMAAPVDVVAQLPSLTCGLQREVPDHVETNLYAIQRIERDAPKLADYERMLQESAAEMEDGPVRVQAKAVANAAFSDGASVFQGLQDHQMHDESANDQWMAAYERLMRKVGLNPYDVLVMSDRS